MAVERIAQAPARQIVEAPARQSGQVTRGRFVDQDYVEIAASHDTVLDTGFGALTGGLLGLAVTLGNPVGAGVGAVVGGIVGFVKSRFSLNDTEQKANLH